MRRLVFAIILATALYAPAALAQGTQFQGRITDPQNAVVVGAVVRIVNQQNGVAPRHQDQW
jgi:hypothetical protein